MVACIVYTVVRNASSQEKSLQDLSVATAPPPNVVMVTAKEILSLDPTKPKAAAVAVVGELYMPQLARDV
ncbi:hypothetical protein [Lacipirellula limnantheis]|uniref:hypothetical protein n=1 Tax=Lacipirellula limnantheis TaxID=2528024 RepID=UPI00143D160A|nr:hypothetical protein [Lacipirellula limnantheis]